jgi:pSer/pThr/pTyr-binding forkhead associated (FHA) protein
MNLFWEACGATGPLHLRVQSDKDPRGTIHVFPQPFVVVGQDGKNDLQLSHPDVSMRHAYLQVIAGRLYCVDLQSRTGIFWKTGSQQAGWLEPGEAVRIGPYVVHVLEEGFGGDGEDADAASYFVDAPHLPAVCLEFLRGGAEQGRWRMNGTVVQVGNATDCGVRLVDPSVSRFHCSLVRTHRGLWAVDLLGRGGICVNGTMVRCARLKDGDELQVGRYLIRFRNEVVSPAGPGLVEPALANQPDWQGALPGVGPAAELAAPAGVRALPPPGVGLSGAAVPLPVPRTEGALVPAGGAGPGSELSTAALMPLLNQFGLMQQQMFEQFQQTTLLLVQMFTSLHGNQLAVIREELQRVHRLNRELHGLYAELARNGRTPAEATSPKTAAGPAGNPDKPASRPAMTTAGGSKPVPPKEPARAPEPARPTPAPAASPRPGGPPRAENPARKPAAAPAEITPPPGSPPPADGNMHAWLSQRIASLQQEQQSSWQRILSFVLGSKTEEALP